VPRPGDGTLLCVDLQFEAPFDGAGQARHDPPARLLAADVDVTVIRVPHEPVAATLKREISSSNTRFESTGESGPPPAFAGAGFAGSAPGSSRTARHRAHPPSGVPESADEPADPRPELPPRHQPVVVDRLEEFRQVAACAASIRRNNVVAPLLERVEANSESNRNIPNLPGVLGDGAIGGEPAHASDVQQSGFAPALR
jgi:hypothetical protein